MSETSNDTPWTKLFTLAFNGPTFYRHNESQRVALCTQPEPPTEGEITWLDPYRPLGISTTHDREWGYIPVLKPNTEEQAYAYAWVYHIFQLASGLEWPVVAHNRVFKIELMQPGSQAVAEGAPAAQPAAEDAALREAEDAMITAAIAAAQAPAESPPAS